MKSFNRALLILVVLCACVGCDQATKTVAREHLATASPVHLIGGAFRFQYTENSGALLGLGADLSTSVRFWALIVIVGAVLVGVLRFIWTFRGLTPVGILGGSLIVGGGFSNLVDRIFHNGAVVDFMNVGVGRLRTGIFNIADVAIMTGVGTLLVSSVSLRNTGPACPACGTPTDPESATCGVCKAGVQRQNGKPIPAWRKLKPVFAGMALALLLLLAYWLLR